MSFSKQLLSTLLFSLIGIVSYAQPTICVKCMEDVWSEDGTRLLYQNYRVLPAYDNGYYNIPRLDQYGKPIPSYPSSYVVYDATDGFTRWETDNGGRIFTDANGSPRAVDTIFVESDGVLQIGDYSIVKDYQNINHGGDLVIFVKQGGKLLFNKANLKLGAGAKIVFDFEKINVPGNEKDNRLMMGYTFFSTTAPFGENSLGEKFNGRGNNSGKQCPISTVSNTEDNSYIQFGEKPTDPKSKEQYQWALCGLDKQLEVIERLPAKGAKPGKLYSIRNNTLYLNHKINSINFYDWTGNMVKQFENQSEINLEGLNGLIMDGTIAGQLIRDRIPVVKQ